MKNKMKDILISVVGLTPQVITETVYYFYKLRKPGVELKEIYVITTSSGKEKIEEVLFKEGIFNELCKKLGIPSGSIKFDDSCIYLITDKNGVPLRDIRTLGDNEQVAEMVWRVIKKHTDRNDVNVHCSVAGGRKTMGVYAAIVMFLLARRGDTLSHILVDEEKESSNFYYPLNEEDEKKLSLAEIPFLRLREILGISEKKINFVDRIRNYQKELEMRVKKYVVKINFEDKEIDAGEAGKIKLTGDREFFVYTFLLINRKECGCDNGCKECFMGAKDILSHLPAYLEKYKRYISRIDKIENVANDQWTLRELFTRINGKIENSGILEKEFFKISKIGPRGNYRYGIKLPPKSAVKTQMGAF